MVSTEQQPYLNTREDAPFRFLGVPMVMKATAETTGGGFGLMESWEMPVGFASPYHRHHREDEAFYVIEGQMAFVCDGKWLQAGPGTFVFGPKGIAHGFKVKGNGPARMLLLCSPGGFERFVLEQAVDVNAPPAPPDMAKLMELAAKFEIDILGDLPEEGPEEKVAPRDGKSLTLAWIEAFNTRDWETERAVRGAEFRAYLSGMKEPLDNEGWSGFIHGFTAGFPDARITVESSIAEGEGTACRWSLKGTHRGEFQGIPATGKTVVFSGIEFNRVAEGKVLEHHSQFDLVGLLRQLGAMQG